MRSNKLLITITILIMFLSGVCFGEQWIINHKNVSNPRLLRRLLDNRIETLDDQVADLQVLSGGLADNIGTGDIFYVDSVTGSDSDAGTTWALAKATLDAAVGLCTDGNHDIIFVASAHEETISTVTLDIDDVTVIGIGSGVDMPEFTFNGTADEFVVDAQGVTVYNLRFLATIAEVVNAFDLQDESDYFKLLCCEFPEPVTATHEFDVVIQLVTGADNVTIAYNTFINQAATPGCSKFIDGGAAAVDSLTVVGNYINADMEIAAIFSDKTDTNFHIVGNTIIQEDVDQMCIELTSTAMGVIADNKFGNLGGPAYILDPGSAFCFGNTFVGAVDQDEQSIPRTSHQINYISDLTSAMTLANGYGAADDPVIFTVTGDILARVFAIVNTNCTSTSSDTLELGVTGDTACLLIQDVVDAAAFQANDVWTLAQAPDTPSADQDGTWTVIPNGLDIKLTINDHDMTAGVIEFYLQWIALSADATVVGAAP